MPEREVHTSIAKLLDRWLESGSGRAAHSRRQGSVDNSGKRSPKSLPAPAPFKTLADGTKPLDGPRLQLRERGQLPSRLLRMLHPQPCQYRLGNQNSGRRPRSLCPRRSRSVRASPKAPFVGRSIVRVAQLRLRLLMACLGVQRVSTCVCSATKPIIALPRAVPSPSRDYLSPSARLIQALCLRCPSLIPACMKLLLL